MIFTDIFVISRNAFLWNAFWVAVILFFFQKRFLETSTVFLAIYTPPSAARVSTGSGSASLSRFLLPIFPPSLRPSRGGGDGGGPERPQPREGGGVGGGRAALAAANRPPPRPKALAVGWEAMEAEIFSPSIRK